MVRTVLVIGLLANLVHLPVHSREETNSLGMELRLIEGGRFLRGSDLRERGLALAFPLSINAQYFGNAEQPAHVTWITKPFWIGKCEVTVDQWKAFVEATGYKTTAEKSGKGIVGWSPTPVEKPLYQSHDFERKPEFTWKNPGFKQSDNHPVVGVSYQDVTAFLKWLSKKEGVTYRLPTEAEWEFACRAGTDTHFSFGDQPRGTVHRFANVGNVELEKFRKYSVERQWLLDWDKEPGDGHVFTAPVGNFVTNGFGLSDMHGNVWEWCADLYLDTFYKRFDWPKRGLPRKVAVDPVNHSEPQTNTNQFRAIRGGCWYNGPVICRSANRTYWDEPDAACYLGFRVVKEAAPSISTKAAQGYQTELNAREAIKKAGGTFYADRGLNLEVRFEGANPFDPEVFSHLAKVPGIEKLSLAGKNDVSLATKHLETIARIKDLKQLIFRTAFDLKDADLSVLKSLPTLEKLEFPRSISITDSDLKKLSGLKHLKSFTCYGTSGGITDQGASCLKGNRELESLMLWETNATGAFLKDFFGCPIKQLAISRVYNADPIFGDSGAKHLAKFPLLTSLYLNEQSLLTDATLTVLGKLDKLDDLSLYGCAGFSDRGFEPLKQLRNLNSLDLRGTAASDSAVAHLVEMPRLQRLKVGENLTDKGFRELSKIFSLEDLYIGNSTASDEGLRFLGRINRLERLDIGSTKITGTGLGPLTRLPYLKDLRLRCPSLTDVAFDHLSRAKNLQKIRLVERDFQPPASLTNDGIMKMASATWLSELWLPRNDTGITEEAINELNKRMPKTGVIAYTVSWK